MNPPSPKKSVAVVTPVFPPYRGGIGTVAVHHAALLSRRGFDVTVFTPDYGTARHDNSQSVRVEYVHSFLQYGNAAWVPSLTKKLKHFDCVLLQYPFFGGARAVYDAKQKYAPRLITNYNMDVAGSGAKGIVFRYVTHYFLPRLLRISDAVLTSSRDYARHSALGPYWRAHGEKFKILPHGVDVARFVPAARNDYVLKKHGIDPDKKIVLFVGGLDAAHYFKGVDCLIKAAAALTEPVTLVIAGKGELRSQYESCARKSGIHGHTVFTGGVSDDELVSLYQSADVTVLPSIDQSEAFGIVLVESMACGTPVIASSLPGVRSVFEEGISGYAVEPKNIRALTEKISVLLRDEQRARQMGANARERVLCEYDWERIGDALARICAVP